MDPKNFDQRLRIAHEHLMAGAFDECVEAARSLRRELEGDAGKTAQDTNASQMLGWAFFYETKGLYEMRRHQEIDDLLRIYRRVSAPMSYKNESWLYSAGAETARVLGKADDVVSWGRLASAIAAKAGDGERSFRAATAAAWLLKDMGAEERNDEFALYLLEEGFKRADSRALADGIAHVMTNFNKTRRGELVRYLVAHAEIIPLAIQTAAEGFAASLEHWFLRNEVLDVLEKDQRIRVEWPLRLCQAAHEGDLEKIGKAVAKGAKINDSDIVAGRTALMAAVLGGQPKAVDVLLESGADPNLRNPQGRTAVVMAADHGHGGIIRSLLAQGGDPMIGDSRGVTALHAAAVGGFVEIVAMMIEAGVDADHMDEFGNTPLIRAAAMGHVPVMKILVANKADIDARGSRKVTPLIAAAQECRLEAVRWLLDQGADPDGKDENGMGAIEWVEYVASRDESMKEAAAAVLAVLKEE